jgi:hypothetical protein
MFSNINATYNIKMPYIIFNILRAIILIFSEVVQLLTIDPLNLKSLQTGKTISSMFQNMVFRNDSNCI